jgi:predicted transport protein
MKYEIVQKVYYNHKGKEEKCEYLIRYRRNILGFKWYKFITHIESLDTSISFKVKTPFKSVKSAKKYIKNVLNVGKKTQETDYIQVK